jgi:hypothetical protein
VDISEKAIGDAQEWVDAELQKLKDAGKPGPTGKIDLVAGDFFKDDWVESLALSGTGEFDVIYDYAVNLSFYPLIYFYIADFRVVPRRPRPRTPHEGRCSHGSTSC